VFSGRGCVAARLDEVLASLGTPIVAVVADAGAAAAGVLDAVNDSVATVELVMCAQTPPDPGLIVVERAVAAAHGAGAGAVLGIGGGSALGAAKAVAIRLANEGSLLDWQGRGRVPRSPVPSVAIPTTAGSGSEVSGDLVLHEPGRERLVVVSGRGVEPDVALLDAELLRALPREPLVEAAFDALSHALEALWARRATRFTDALAFAAAEEICAVLPRGATGDVDALQSLLEASAMANLACGNTHLGLVHALTSAPSVTLSHGYQNAVLLGPVARFNREVVSARGRAIIDRLPALYREVGFIPLFDERLDRVGSAAMLAAGLRSPLRENNRRPSALADLVALLTAAGAPIA
jgi:alcohol dehydrogenase class IV